MLHRKSAYRSFLCLLIVTQSVMAIPAKETKDTRVKQPRSSVVRNRCGALLVTGLVCAGLYSLLKSKKGQGGNPGPATISNPLPQQTEQDVVPEQEEVEIPAVAIEDASTQRYWRKLNGSVRGALETVGTLGRNASRNLRRQLTASFFDVHTGISQASQSQPPQPTPAPSLESCSPELPYQSQNAQGIDPS